MLTNLYQYDLLEGLLIIARVLFLLILLVSIRYSVLLFRALKEQDEILSNDKSGDFIPHMVTYFRSFIIYVIGYRGESREITQQKDVNSAWMKANWYYVFRRFLVFYSIYITFGILLTRPVYMVGDSIFFYNYDQQNFNAIFYLVLYILSNAVADYFSIYFTFRNLEKISESGRVFYYGAIDLVIAALFFLPNQIISCVLWYVKRAENNLEFSDNILPSFVDIVFWPYALVGNVEANTVIGSLFPGQLLITGTVFFPTIAMISIMILYRLFLIASYYIKKVLIYIGIEEFCKKYVEFTSYNPFRFQTSNNFGYCNTALIFIFNSFLLSFAWDNTKSLFIFFRG